MNLSTDIYSPSPKYPAACCRDERRGEPRQSSVESAQRRRLRRVKAGLASAQFRFDTPQFAAGSFIVFGFDLRSLNCIAYCFQIDSFPQV